MAGMIRIGSLCIPEDKLKNTMLQLEYPTLQNGTWMFRLVYWNNSMVTLFYVTPLPDETFDQALIRVSNMLYPEKPTTSE